MDYELLLNKIEGLVSPILDNLGFELIEREFVFDQGRFVLRLYIDREESSITIDDCETASRAVEGVLDVENLIPRRYSLEVSSPGLNRPLRRAKDFERFKGFPVEVDTKQWIEGRHHFVGILQGLMADKIILQEEKQQWQIPLGELKKARVRHEFKR